MLHEFLLANHDELEKRCRAKSAARVDGATSADSVFGVPWFITQLVAELRAEQGPASERASVTHSTNAASSAGQHGKELLNKGFTVDQVVHDYGDLCQALTELAHEKNQEITVNEFHTFNRCLDNATADAVSEFSRGRVQEASDATTATMNERLGALAHELRNQLGTAMLAFTAIKSGSVATSGATGTCSSAVCTVFNTSSIDRSPTCA